MFPGFRRRVGAEILVLLKQGPASVPELAAGFGVSVRTVQRDMGACSDAKFPVVSPKQSVYSFAEGFSLDAAQLSCEEAALLIVSAAIAKQFGGSFGAAQQQVARLLARLRCRGAVLRRLLIFLKLTPWCRRCSSVFGNIGSYG